MQAPPAGYYFARLYPHNDGRCRSQRRTNHAAHQVVRTGRSDWCEPLPDSKAGAHVDVTLPNGLVRSYSLLNHPGERNRYVIAVLREEAGGGGSAWVHDALKPGDVLSITPPQNRFELDEGGDHNFLIAGGIGITPILSMAERLDELGIDFKLYYCTRNREETAFAELIEKRFGGRHVFHHDGGLREQSLDVEALLRVREPGTHVYVCGPPGLIQAVRNAAHDWPKGTVHFELFGAGRVEVATENKPFDIHLKRRNVTFHIPADRTILEVLAENDVRVRSIVPQRRVSAKHVHRTRYVWPAKSTIATACWIRKTARR